MQFQSAGCGKEHVDERIQDTVWVKRSNELVKEFNFPDTDMQN
jgi:hypothetical protein